MSLELIKERARKAKEAEDHYNGLTGTESHKDEKFDALYAAWKSSRDVPALIAALEAAEYRLKYLDAIEESHPTLPGKPNASAGGVASVLRKDISNALEGK